MGRHILAHFDQESIVVYRAYRPSIGRFAAQDGYFGGDFKYTRMSWIKPNSLWMMYRSDWGRSKGQEVVLAIRISHQFFDALLRQAVFSSFGASGTSDPEERQSVVSLSQLRLQWDPDHLPSGDKCERRAVQLGLCGDVLDPFGKHEPIEILDISEFVAEQREHVKEWKSGQMLTPYEAVYVPNDSDAAKNIGLDVSR